MSCALPDPYRVLCLRPGAFTIEQLRSNYRRLALQLHPDKNRTMTGEEARSVFHLLTASYKQLKSDLARQQVPPMPQERRGRDEHQQEEHQRRVFKDAGHFNRAFEAERRQTVHDAGYADWMSTAAVDDRKRESDCLDLQVQAYREPAAVSAVWRAKGHLAGEELGLDRIDDFSADAVIGRPVGYTDLKTALGRNADGKEQVPAAGEDTRPRSMEELKSARSRSIEDVSMTAGEAWAYARFQQLQAEKEAARMARVQQGYASLRIE